MVLNAVAAVGQPISTLRQFYFNPFVVNPAFTGSEGHTEIMLVHRQQWINIEDAPNVSGAFFQYATHTRVSLGLSVLSEEAVNLRTTTAKGILAYRLPIGSKQSLFFGMSVGAGFNDLELEGDYSNDPTILDAAASKTYLDGSFGLVYTLGQLKFGFALPTLFDRPYFSPSTLGQTKFSQLTNQFYSLSYTLNPNHGPRSIEPYFLYRLNRDTQNSWEAAVVTYYKNLLWLGSNYSNTLGLGFFTGISVKDRFRLAYGYEIPPFHSELSNTSSHEIRISVRIGEKKKLRAEEP
jgi:type IX secretion system PorP/SprF family membrane protein